MIFLLVVYNNCIHLVFNEFNVVNFNNHLPAKPSRIPIDFGDISVSK